MKDARGGQKVRRKASESIPGGVVLLAAALKRTSPEVHDMVPKCTQTRDVGWHRVVSEVSAHHLAQPLTLLRDRFVHTSPQFFLDGSQLGPHPVPARLPLKLEEALSGAAADVREAKKVERLRFAKTAPRSILGRKAAELDQASLVRMQRECELLRPLLQCCMKALGISLVLEAADNVVGVAHEDDAAGGVVMTPPVCPQVEDVMEVDVRQQG